MKLYFFLLACLPLQGIYGQPAAQKIAHAMQQLEADVQMRHAIAAIYVAEGQTGKRVYAHQAETGLAAASTQKIFTSCAAFELLGKDFRYVTEIGYNQCSDPSRGYFIIRPSTDPSLGSSRYASTQSSLILDRIAAAVQEKQLAPVAAVRLEGDSLYGNNSIPGGWIWEDIGNYYGAGVFAFNWLENQYDIIMQPGKHAGDPVTLLRTTPENIYSGNLVLKVASAAPGTGDNTIVYPGLSAYPSLVEGTIPAGSSTFTIHAAIPHPLDAFSLQLAYQLQHRGITVIPRANNQAGETFPPGEHFTYIPVYRHLSPALDSLHYWFLKKSINLYGEAFLRTMAAKKTGSGTTENGLRLLKDFWQQQGIAPDALHIADGSGLSPQNRVTAAALVRALQYARSRPWFDLFYQALPEYNGMKMKSGSIGGARAYAGYHTAKNGMAYTFAIIVNNYDGAAAAVVKKMFMVLDNLK